MNLSVVERKTRLIGAILVERGLITPVQLKEALELQTERGGLLGEIVTAEFGVSQVEVSQAIAEQLADLEAGTGADPSPATGRQLRSVGPSADGETRVRIGDALLELGLVDRAQIDAALEVQRQSGERLGEILVSQGVISRLELAGALSEHWASLTKLRGPGEPAPVQAVTSEASTRELQALATQVEGLGAKLDALPRVAAGDADMAVLLERVSAKVDELTVPPSDVLAGQVERLSARFDELVAAVSSDRLGSLDEGQRREEEILARLVGELAGLREETSAKLEAIAGSVGGDEEVSAQVARLSVKVDELVAATPTDRLEERIASLDQGQRREEDVLGRVVAEIAALREEADARLDAIAGSAGGDQEISGQLERLSARFDELLAGELAGQFERLSVTLDELVAAGHSDRLGSLDEGQRREEEILARLVGELAGLREETSAKLEAIAGSVGGDEEISAQVERLSARFDELLAAVSSDQLGALGEGQRRGEELLDRLVLELAGLREEADARLEAIARVARGDGELAGQVERLSARFDELVAAVSSDRLGSLDEGQRREEEILARLVGELAGLREETSAKLEAIAGSVGGDEEVSAQVARLSVKVDELVAATPTDRLEERIASLDQGQRREEDVLGRVVAEMAALREDARALHGKSETDVAREVAAQVERFSAMISEPGAPPDEHLTGQLERLAARFDELVAAVPWDQIRSLGEGQRRDEEALGRLVSEFAALREETDAKLDAIASAEAARSQASAGAFEALVASLEGVGAGLEERGAGRDVELAAQVERLSAKIGELSVDTAADQLADRIDSLAEAQRRTEDTLERLLAELAVGREPAETQPRPADFAVKSSDGSRAKKNKKKKR